MSEISELLREISDIRRRVEALGRLESSSSGLPANVVKFSGTPTAGNYAYWTGDGTVANSGFGTSQLPRYSGTPTAGAITYWTGAGTVTGWTFGTADVFLLSTSQTVTGAKTFDNNTTIAGTATAGTAFAVTRNLAAASTNSPVVSIIQDNAGDDQAALIVQQDGTGAIQEWYDGATRVGVFLDGGLLGIGPGDPLVQAHIVSEASAATRGVLVAQHTGDAAAAVVFFRKSRGTKGSPSTIVNGDYGGALAQQYYDGTSYRQTAAIVFRSNGTVASNSMPTDILFAAGAADDPNITNERVRITSAGVLIVGLTSAGASGLLAVKAGTSSNDAAVGGVLYVNTTVVGNVGGGTDDLMSYSVPANTLAVNGQSIEYEAAGTCTSGCTLNVVWGGTTIVTKIAAATGDYVVRARIIRTGAATQKCWGEIQFAGAAYDGAMNYVTAAETLSGAVTAKLTAVGTSNNDVVQEMFIVSFADNNT